MDILAQQTLSNATDDNHLVQQISGLGAWWVADEIASADRSAGEVVTWRDKSGNGNHVTSATNRPQFNSSNAWMKGHASVDFVAANSERLAFGQSGAAAPLATALSGSDTPYTLFIAFRKTLKHSSGNEVLFGLCDSAGTGKRHPTDMEVTGGTCRHSSGFRIADDATNANVLGPSGLIDQSPNIRCDVFNGTTIDNYIVGYSDNPTNDLRQEHFGTLYNGDPPPGASAAMNVNTVSFNRVCIGMEVSSSPNSPCNAEIAEVIVYTRALATEERVRVADYLRNKYFPDFDRPSDIPGLVHHWDASLLSGAVSSAVSSFPDQVAGGKDFAQATGANQPTIALGPNGLKVLRHNGTSSFMTAGAVADWKYLHDATEHATFICFRIRDVDDNKLHPLIDTVNDDTVNNIGLGMYFDDSATNRCLRTKVGQGTATAILNHTSSADLLRPQAWQITGLQYEAVFPSTEYNYQHIVNGQIYAQTDQGATPSSSNASNVLTLGALAGGVTFAKVDIAEIISYDRPIGRYGFRKISEYLAKKWGAQHVAVVGGNGRAAAVDGALYDNGFGGVRRHRGFPLACCDENDVIQTFYRGGERHEATTGDTIIHRLSPDGITFTPELVVVQDQTVTGKYTQLDGFMLRLNVGAYAGRLLMVFRWTLDTGDYDPRCQYVMYSDNNGGNWSTPVAADADSPIVYANSGSAHGLCELADGRVIMIHSGCSSPSTDHARTIIRYSSNGGQTWGAGTQIQPASGAQPADDKEYNEPSIIRLAADGVLVALIRVDGSTPVYHKHHITTSSDNGATWSAEYVVGWRSGHPAMIEDTVQDVGRVYIFYRANGSHTGAALLTNATNASPIVVTSARHGLVTGDGVTISGVVGNTAANASWTVTRVDQDTFSLDGSTGSGAYVSGGTYVNALADKLVYRYSDDIRSSPPTWSKERRLEWGAHPRMAYAAPFKDSDGNIWIIYSLEDGKDADVFCTQFLKVN